MFKNKDTIFALSTPTGKSAIAVFRISGKETKNILKSFTKKKIIEPNKATVTFIYDDKKNIVDKVLTIFFKGPKSYTGEDMAEISAHGSPSVIKKITELLNKKKNARIAEPGEFTKRSFEAGKLDLTQVEAVADLVNSETESQRSQATNQLNGLLTNKINTFSNKIIKILADIEALIDFSDEELPDNLDNIILEQIENTITDIKYFLNDNRAGEKIRNGFVVSITGKTNTGKSSFLNYIAKREISIVTNEPGTTRDLIELFYEHRGLPIKFYDTAGIMRSKSKAELIGIQKSITVSEIADIRLVFIESEKEILKYKNQKNCIFIMSKQDIRNKLKKKKKYINISSKSGYGIKKVLLKIYKTLKEANNSSDINISRERHRKILEKTLKYLKLSKKKKNTDLFAEDIRQAHKEISKISGKNDIEDILDIIFNDFCIGK